MTVSLTPARRNDLCVPLTPHLAAGLSEAFSAKSASSWSGVLGSEHKPSAAEWKRLLRGERPRLFLLFGTGSAPGTFAPEVLASTRVDCNAVVLLDQVHTMTSIKAAGDVLVS